MRATGHKLLSVLVLSLALGAVFAPSAFAKAEEIAYRCDVDICLGDPDSFNSVVDLTENGLKSLDGHPAWSPNGSKVAFVGTDPHNEADRTQNIYVMEPGKGEASNIALQLTFYTGNTYGAGIDELAWSADGTRIAYARTASYGAHSGIFVVAADGTTATPVPVAADGAHPSWAPDGGKIAYSSYAEQIYTANPDGSGTAPLPEAHGKEPTWSPDGTQIAFGQVTYQSTFVDLHIVGAGCGASPVVVPIPYPAEYTQWADPSWSPDGGRISYRATFENGFGYERVVGRYGGESLGLPKVQKVNMGGGWAASWSPNGQRLAFDGYSAETTGREVYVGNANGSGSVSSIATGGKNSEASWRPDPQVTPHVPVVCKTVPETAPGGGGNGSGNSGGNSGGPGGQRPPKLVWFTKRIPITASAPIHMMIVGCSAPRCSVGTSGTSRAVGPPSVPRVARISKKKPKRVVVGTGKLDLLEGQTKTLDMYLTKAGKTLFKQQGKLDIEATVKVTAVGQATVTSKRTIHVVLAKPKKKKKR